MTSPPSVRTKKPTANVANAARTPASAELRYSEPGQERPGLLDKQGRFEISPRGLLFLTHATAGGAITSLALATINTALWDLRCKRRNQPLWIAAGGTQARPMYNSESGWLNLSATERVENAQQCQEKGFGATKLKVGFAIKEDMARLPAVGESIYSPLHLGSEGAGTPYPARQLSAY